MKWIVVIIENIKNHYGFLLDEDYKVKEFENIDDAYRAKASIKNATIVPVTKEAKETPMSSLATKVITQYERAEYWKRRAFAESDAGQYEPSDPKTYPKYLEAKKKLDKLKEEENDYK